MATHGRRLRLASARREVGHALPNIWSAKSCSICSAGSGWVNLKHTTIGFLTFRNILRGVDSVSWTPSDLGRMPFPDEM